ncbi:hypothetical protein Q8F55_002523 [Vanrija albida]|uniref:F-box domain-containing protein n=1 Tax=Vanrija albida TaxID=181172 RepID=A0ABR3QA64_9TREE
MPIDAEAYPHVIDAILQFADASVLLRFRATCRELHARVDALFLTHVEIGDEHRRDRDGMREADPDAAHSPHPEPGRRPGRPLREPLQYWAREARLCHITTVDAHVTEYVDEVDDWQAKRLPFARAASAFAGVTTVRVHDQRDTFGSESVVDPTPGQPHTLVIFQSESQMGDRYGRMDVKFWGCVDMTRLNKVTKRVPRRERGPLYESTLAWAITLPAACWPREAVVIFVQDRTRRRVPGRNRWSEYAFRIARHVAKALARERQHNFPKHVPRPPWTVVDLDAAGDISAADALERVWDAVRTCTDLGVPLTAELEHELRPRVSLLTRDQYGAIVGPAQLSLESEE